VSAWIPPRPLDAGFIVDPTDPTRAIAPSGNLAARISFAPAGADPDDETAWTPLGFIDPKEVGW